MVCILSFGAAITGFIVYLFTVKLVLIASFADATF